MPRKYQKIILSVAFWLCTSILLLAQHENKVIVISDIVGPVIDSTERKKYDLFPEYSDEDFKLAQVAETPEGIYQLWIFLKSRNDKIVLAISNEERMAIIRQINKKIINFNRIDTTSIYTIILEDETELYGRFTEIREYEVDFESISLGKFTIRKSKIYKVNKKMSSVDLKSKLYFDNPHESRLYFAPTARNLPQGEGYFQDIYLLIISANYAVTDYFTIGGGTTIIPFMSLYEQGLFINPKLGFKISDKWNLGGGFFLATIGTEDSDEMGTETRERQNAGIYY